MIFMSDATHLTNFSGDKKAWPVYMTIGNLSTTVRMAPSHHGILLIALLPIPIKMRDVPMSVYNTQKEHNRMIQQHVLRHVLEPLMDENSRVFYARCADSYFRRCVASPAAWIADYPEHRDLHNIKNGICYWCECPHEEMGEFPVEPYERRDHALYKILSDTNTPAAKARLTRHGVHQGSNVLWHLDCVVSDLPKPDLLHTIQLGMLKHLLGWLQDFLKQHKRLEVFNNIWLSVPPYLDMAQPQKAYGEVSSWQGKEIKVMSRFLVAVLRCALRTPSPSQRGVFDDAIGCCRALVEFYFYAQYESHDEETLGLMDDALKRFHIFKRVFRQFRVSKKVTQDGKEHRKTLIEQRDAAMQGKSVAGQERLRKEWQSFINAEMVEYNEEGSDFNFPKIHQLLHFGEQIRRYGSLKQWSTETGESSHRTQLKDPYNKSNRSGDIYGQMIEYYLRSDAFAIRRLNIAAKRGENAESGRDSIEDSLAGVRFTSEQSSSVQAKTISFAQLLTSLRGEDLQNELCRATNRFLLSRKIKIGSNDLLQCPVNVYHGVRIPLSNMYGERMIQYVRCTGEKSWYGQPARHDWVWVQASKQREDQEPAYGALRGRLPYRLLKLFKLSADGGPFWCAFVQTTTPAAGGTPERASSMVKVTQPTTGSGYAVISGDSIGGAAHLIPEEPDCSGISNKGWMVNSHIDLATWNEVY
jgi:hypothetical protein